MVFPPTTTDINMKRALVWACLCWQMQIGNLCGQSFLASDPSIAPPNGIVRINLLTCEITPVASNLNIGNFTDFWMTDDGQIYIVGFGPGPAFTPTLFRHNPANGTTVALQALPAWGTTIYGIDNNTLIVEANGFFLTYDIADNTLTTVGFVSGFNGLNEFFEYDGTLYISNTNTSDVFEVVLTPDFELVPASLLYGYGVSICGSLFGPPSGASVFAELDPLDGTNNWLCFDDFNNSGFGSYAPDPFNESGPLCGCETESGTFETPPFLLSDCSFNPIPLPHNGDENLDSDDNLVFVLATWDYSDYPDVQYTIIATYTDPVATFIPGVTVPGVNYIVFAMAADAVGNTIDLDDPCLEVSDYIQVVWSESPTVSFAAAAEVCDEGCQTVSVNFTGTPPFALTYKVTIGASEQTFTESFPSSSGSFQVCPPSGFTGTVAVEGLDLTDANCDCEP